MRALIALALLSLLPAAGPAEGIKVTTDRTVDTGSLDSIVRDVVRLAGAKTNDEKAIAIHTWLHHAIFHNAYPVEKSPQSVGPLKAIRVYGWGLCGGQHTVLKALFETAGWKVRYRGWDGHTTVEVFYDERWHYFDVFLKCYYWTKDHKTIAGQDDINQDPSIVLDAEKEGRVPPDHYLCCGDEAKGVVDGCKTSKPYPPSEPKDGWASVTGRDQGYSPALTLPPGATLRLEWKGESGQIAVGGSGRHSCGTKDFRSDKDLGPVLEHYGPRNHSNGRLTYAPDFARAADVASVALHGAEAKVGKLTATGGQGVAVFALPLPYVYVSAELEAVFEGDGKLSVSVDGGKTWQPVPGRVEGPAAGGDVSAIVKQKYDVQVRAEFSGSLAKLRVEAVVEHNRSAQPYLLQGRNLVSVSSGRLAPASALSVTYAFQEATAPDPAKRKRFEDQGVTYAPAKTLTHEGAAEPWTIEVGGNTAPKMLYLEYSVRGQ
jgi:hypothetical protein